MNDESPDRAIIRRLDIALADAVAEIVELKRQLRLAKSDAMRRPVLPDGYNHYQREGS